ncbi:MAG TPA: hypothetical protein PKG69_05960, partial [Methanoregulaceae archaeon]|nr:hypothetical protein [Methanoregulaceae archaeon]
MQRAVRPRIIVGIMFSLCLFTTIVGAAGDLDGDGIADDLDPETIVTVHSILSAGEHLFQDLIVTNGATLTVESNRTGEGFMGTSIQAGEVRIDTTSSITATGKGYPQGE